MDFRFLIADLGPENVETWAAARAAQEPPVAGSSRSYTAADADPASFAAAVLLSDWLCYTKPEDRVDFARLRKILTAFPDGFRLYAAGTTPIGYAAWHPVAEDVFQRLYAAPETVTHRGQIMPAPLTESPYIYLFNYSVLPALRGTALSKQLVTTLAADIARTNPKGLCAVTVSEDGQRVAKKFGMIRRGQATHEGAAEDVYAVLF